LGDEVRRNTNLTPLVLLCLLSILGRVDCAYGETYRNIKFGGFSPDGSKISLSYCTAQQSCRFGYYDNAKREFIELSGPEKDQVLGPGGFSPDGTGIAVSIRRGTDGGRFSQIGILQLGNKRLTHLTDSKSYKSAPSFSHDGKRIIFSQSNREREAGATRFTDWDIYDLSIEGKTEHRLTAHRFYQVSPPSYLPDDHRFIFSGDSPREYVSISGKKGYNAYSEQHGDNRIFIVSPGANDRLAPIFTNGVSSDFPRISADGSKVFYVARTNSAEGLKTKFTHDLFLFDGKSHKRLTRVDGQVVDFSVSFDGNQVAFAVYEHKTGNVRGPNILDIRNDRIEMLDFSRLAGH